MQNPNKEKRVPPAPKDNKRTDEKVTFIAYGDVHFNSSMKGKFPSPTKRITDAVAKMSEDSKGKTEIIFVDGYLTSQTCNNCKEQNLNHIPTAGSKHKLHVVLKCDSCNTVWNRDVMAAKNIHNIFKT